MPHTILLVDDHPVFRQGLRLLLEKEKDLKVVGEAGDGLEAIDRLRELSPDIVVMDISMPNLDGIEATKKILEESPDTRVVALSVHSGKRFVRDMLQAGASGYILKESVPEEMIQGIRTVLGGEVYLSTAISVIVVSEFRKLLSRVGPEEDTSPEPILRTKLHTPPVSADIIPRARLIELLEKGRQRPMTLISAPAGYGKSVLASQWLETCGRPGVWLSLDENDSDLRQFLIYLLEAVQEAFSSVELQTRTLLQAANLPPVKVLAHNLLNDLEQVKEPFILLLDDYHCIREDAVHDLLTELLRYPSPMLHLAVVTRRDPPLPISPMRAGGQLTEITIEHLRFNLSETKAFFERLLNVSPAENTLAILEQKMEGWGAGLRLAALSMGRKGERDFILKDLGEGAPLVHGYLMQEVLSQVPPIYASFLVETSILDRFCAPLCDAVYLSKGQPVEHETGGQEFIEWLKTTHLFVVPLDETHTWFRYHHLFQQLLQNQLEGQYGPEEIAALHSRAADWFAENGFINEAFRHALAANDMPGAIHLIEQHRQAMLNSNRWHVFEKWLDMLPDPEIEQRPELLMAKVWICYFQSKYTVIPPILAAAESLLSNKPREQPLYGEIYLFNAVFSFWQGDISRSVKYIEDALERIPETQSMVRGFAEIYFGLAGHMNGQRETVLQVLSDLLNHSSMESPRKLRLVVGLVWVHLLSGDLVAAAILNRQLMDAAREKNFAAFISWSAYNQGVIHFYRNEFDSAIYCFNEAAESGYLILKRANVDCLAGLALAYQAMQQTDRANKTIEGVFENTNFLNDPNLLAVAHACKDRLALMRGETTFPHGEKEPAQALDIQPMVFWLEVPAITNCRALLAEGSDTSLKEAEKRLESYLRLNRMHHNTVRIIEIMALQSQAVYRQERLDEALALLGRTIKLAEPGGWVQPFVELGPPMAELLKRLHTQDAAVDFVEKILAAFRDEEQKAQDVPEAPAVPSPSVRPQPLIEPLTNRELDILDLIAERLQTKEIADKLCVSPETVKSHLKNIYQKLGVSNRRAAVEKAKSLGILSGDV